MRECAAGTPVPGAGTRGQVRDSRVRPSLRAPQSTCQSRVAPVRSGNTSARCGNSGSGPGFPGQTPIYESLGDLPDPGCEGREDALQLLTGFPVREIAV